MPTLSVLIISLWLKAVYSVDLNFNVSYAVSDDLYTNATLTCSWSSPKASAFMVVVEVLQDSQGTGCLVKVELTDNAVPAKITRCKSERWVEGRMFVNVTESEIRLTIAALCCSDDGSYSCRVGETNDTVVLAQPNITTPELKDPPFIAHVRYYIGLKANYTCYAAVGTPGTGELYWKLENADDTRAMAIGTTGDDIIVYRYNTGCRDLVRSYLTLTLEDIHDGSELQCYVVKSGLNSTEIEINTTCDSHPFCKSTSPIKIQRAVVGKTDKTGFYDQYITNPSNLSDTKTIYPGHKELSFDCNADIINLDKSLDNISNVQIARTDWEGQRKQYLVYFDLQKLRKFVKGRDWLYKTFEVAENAESSRGVGVRLTMLDVTWIDFGIYTCEVMYWNITDEALHTSVGHQVVYYKNVPKRPVLNLLDDSSGSELVATCSAYVGNDGSLTWILRSRDGVTLGVWTLFLLGWVTVLKESGATVRLVNKTDNLRPPGPHMYVKFTKIADDSMTDALLICTSHYGGEDATLVKSLTTISNPLKAVALFDYTAILALLLGGLVAGIPVVATVLLLMKYRPTRETQQKPSESTQVEEPEPERKEESESEGTPL